MTTLIARMRGGRYCRFSGLKPRSAVGCVFGLRRARLPGTRSTSRRRTGRRVPRWSIRRTSATRPCGLPAGGSVWVACHVTGPWPWRPSYPPEFGAGCSGCSPNAGWGVFTGLEYAAITTQPRHIASDAPRYPTRIPRCPATPRKTCRAARRHRTRTQRPATSPSGFAADCAPTAARSPGQSPRQDSRQPQRAAISIVPPPPDLPLHAHPTSQRHDCNRHGLGSASCRPG